MELLDSESDDEFDAACITAAQLETTDMVCPVTTRMSFPHTILRCSSVYRCTFDVLSARSVIFFFISVRECQQISAEETCLIALMHIGSQTSMYAIAGKFNVVESSVRARVGHAVHFLHSISDDVIHLLNHTERMQDLDELCTQCLCLSAHF